MSELYRFDIDYPVHPEDEEGIRHEPCDNGEYVLAEDALALQAKVEELEAELAMHSDIDRVVVKAFKKLDELDTPLKKDIGIQDMMAEVESLAQEGE